ncbi:hypothetical protein L6452_10133 [Arctium lappa]|uniref:Uncharacterized protein n=1 Tax=Arctium lappa TaxID=4217 RepID=A0ACB9DM53_ARCLA|nr:hypothetical protein L6452_10133 [Arctium lappa]
MLLMKEEQRTYQNPFVDLREVAVVTIDTPEVYARFLFNLEAIPLDDPQEQRDHRPQKKGASVSDDSS